LYCILCCCNCYSATRNITPAISEGKPEKTAVKWSLFVLFFRVATVAGDKVEEDDIHLILEYKKGERWGEYEAPRSNRLAYIAFIVFQSYVKNSALIF